MGAGLGAVPAPTVIRLLWLAWCYDIPFLVWVVSGCRRWATGGPGREGRFPTRGRATHPIGTERGACLSDNARAFACP